jgi:transketolase
MRVTAQEGSPLGWQRCAGASGMVLGMRTFGGSAQMKLVVEHSGFTVNAVVIAARLVMRRVH